ncbi:MAG: GAF domain-containing protein [Pseudomonadota bacterium]
MSVKPKQGVRTNPRPKNTSAAVIEGINRVLRSSLTARDEGEVARACLAVAEENTGSRFGFLGEINEVGTFNTLAISDPGWDACRIPESDAVTQIQGMIVRGLWGTVITTGKPLLTNDPMGHESSVGVPEGHPPLTAFLGVPLNRDGATVGMMAVANRPRGYTKRNIADLEALATPFVEALSRWRLQRELQQNKALLEETVATRTRELSAAKTALEDQVEKLANEILDVSTPVLSVIDGVLLVPVIGAIDSQRAQQFTEELLTAVTAHSAQVVILDLTGVPVVDTVVAKNLIRTVQACKMLGTAVVITGIRSHMAQTMVKIGVDLKGLRTAGSLRAGLRDALAILGKRVADVEEGS